MNGVPGQKMGLFEANEQRQLFNISKPTKGASRPSVAKLSELERIEDDLKEQRVDSLDGQGSFYTTSFEALDNWTKSARALAGNIRLKHRECKKDGTVSISRANFRQIVSTKGVNVPPASFDRLFDQAIDLAALPTGFVR